MPDISNSKAELRKGLRKARRDHAANLPPQVSALVFRRPPGPVIDLVPEGAIVGLYHAASHEAPAAGYARFFMEAGHTLALPAITHADAAMQFRTHTDPFGQTDLEEGPMGIMQPKAGAPAVLPQVLFVPVVGFTEIGHRLGQGGGFYDRYLAEHPGTVALGMAWDVQKVDELPLEDHDMPLTAVITPTRIYGPF
ncbi:5-formyltetrahydrofolate cyclo-ligase [Aurantiacibacter marinus]|uniref:5-formyltetrahydrofolate cyclo-ligase n=2 Tax=Aurantiacibacter marinus TaxID=874156 RepID=A0A0H0XP67_9SPHN|nr:5-formyltetrahydrofolate cyclo-ligase [Aurantiacibacter marinus]